MRINQYIAAAGICSRRKAEEFVREGRVTINGNLVTELATHIHPDDLVMVDGHPIQSVRKNVVYAFHKPLGVTVSLYDPKQKNLISEWIRDIPEHVVPIGRLDKDSTGLLLLSDDGDLVQKLTHPSFSKRKVYEVTLDRKADENALRTFRTGIPLEGKLTQPAQVKDRGSVYEIVLTEGRNRQIRKMWEYLGYRVLTLHRTEMDGVKLGALSPGAYRLLNESEMRGLRCD